jgi:hypothetical protein
MVTPRYAILADMSPARSVTEGPADGLRFRVYVAGELADEHWFSNDADHAEAAEVAHRQAAIAAEADDAGRLWLIEIYDPARPSGRQYMRYGTDQAGMVAPGEVPAAQLNEAVLGLFDALGEDDNGVTR